MTWHEASAAHRLRCIYFTVHWLFTLFGFRTFQIRYDCRFVALERAGECVQGEFYKDVPFSVSISPFHVIRLLANVIISCMVAGGILGPPAHLSLLPLQSGTAQGVISLLFACLRKPPQYNSQKYLNAHRSAHGRTDRSCGLGQI